MAHHGPPIAAKKFPLCPVLHPPDEASCDLKLRRGHLPYPFPPRARRLLRGGQHRISGLCTANTLYQPVFRAALLERIRRR